MYQNQLQNPENYLSEPVAEYVTTLVDIIIRVQSTRKF